MSTSCVLHLHNSMSSPHFLPSSQLLAPASPLPPCPTGSPGEDWACMSACCVLLLLSLSVCPGLPHKPGSLFSRPSWLALLILVASSVPAPREGGGYLLSAHCIPTTYTTFTYTVSFHRSSHSLCWSFVSPLLLLLSSFSREESEHLRAPTGCLVLSIPDPLPTGCVSCCFFLRAGGFFISFLTWLLSPEEGNE